MRARNQFLEQQLAHAYALLWHLPQDEHGSRRVSLGRHGPCDVRLLEVTHGSLESTAKSLWLELYDHDSQVVLDSCRCDAIEEAAMVAQELISHARELDKE